MVTDEGNVNFPVLVVFLDQFLAILKVLSENANSLAEDLRIIDIPSLLYTLATFINKIDPTDPTAARLKLKFCTLCNTVFGRNEPVIMRNKESTVRQSIVDIVMDWVEETTTVSLLMVICDEQVLTCQSFLRMARWLPHSTSSTLLSSGQLLRCLSVYSWSPQTGRPGRMSRTRYRGSLFAMRLSLSRLGKLLGSTAM